MRAVVLLLSFILFVSACGRNEPTQPPLPRRTPSPDGAALAALPCTHRWLAAVNGSWEDPARWDVATVPTSSSIACLDEVGTYTVTLSEGRAAIVLVGHSAGGANVTLQQVSGAAPVPAARLEAQSVYVAQDATISLRDASRIGYLNLADDAVLTLGDNAELRDAQLLMLRGSITVSTGDTLRLSSAGVGTSGVDFGSDLTGDGVVRYTGRTGFADSVTLSSAALGTRTSSPMDPILEIRAAHVTIAADVTGAVDVDPGTRSIFLSGVIDSNAHVRVKRNASGAGNPTVIMGNASGPLLNHGELEFTQTAGTHLPVAGSLLSLGTLTTGTGTIEFRGDSIRNEGTWLIAGTTRVNRGYVRNRGTIVRTVATADLAMQSADYIADAASTMTGRLLLQSGARLSGFGSLDVVTSTGGRLSPGSAAQTGTLTMSLLTLDGTSTVTIDVHGTAPGQYDVVRSTGPATLMGALDIRTLASFTGGVCGQVLPVLTAVPRNASFATTTGTSLAADRAWRVAGNPNDVSLAGYDPTTRIRLASHFVEAVEGAAPTAVSVCLGGGAPTGNVTITPSSRRSQLTAPAIVGTSANYLMPLTLPVSAIDDAIVDGYQADTLIFAVTTTDVNYQVTPAALPGFAVDNEPGADLALTIRSTPATATVNQTQEWRFRIANNGPLASTGSTMVLDIYGATWISSAGISCSLSGTTLTCTAGALASGAVLDFTVLARVPTAGLSVFSANLSSTLWDHVPTNNDVAWVVDVR